jgi:hypothetical protein
LTCSPRHEHSVDRVAALLEKLGAKRKVNDQSRGKDGWRFERVPTWRGEIEYIADGLFIWTEYKLGYEIDYKKKNSAFKHRLMRERDAAIIASGQADAIIHYTPAEVDWLSSKNKPGDMPEDRALKDIWYALKKAKIVLEARA